MSAIEKALKAATQTRDLRMGKGILDQVSSLFGEMFPGQRAVVVADQTTWEVAGRDVFERLQAAGIQQAEPYIFTDADLYAEYSYVNQLTASLQTHAAIPIAVGSGTINDLVKLASHLASRRYLCVATAASMDGYTAFGASITAQGAKQTFECPAPLACLADLDILCRAPGKMTAAGYADLFAKVTAGADWILADALGIEAIDPVAWSIVQDHLHDSLADPGAIATGNAEAVAKLTEGLMLGGFAMQWARSSRPASGAEHQFSHLWNMEHFLNHGEHVSHGFQVSIGTLAVTALYEKVLNTRFDELDIEACCRRWPSAEASDKMALRLFAGTDFPAIGVQETRAKYISDQGLALELNRLKNNWPTIRARLAKQIIPWAEAKRRLRMAGAPTEPEDIGLTRPRLREAFIRAQFIRRRYTVLDLAVRTGLLDKWLGELFSQGGIWEIKD